MTKMTTLKSSNWRDRMSWVASACLVVLFGGGAIWRHKSGDDWPSAFGFADVHGLLRLLGDLWVPAMAIVLMLRQARKLPASREKTMLFWLGWSTFAYLFVWWISLRTALFGIP